MKTNKMENKEIAKKFEVFSEQLLLERNKKGFWVGELSSSALSTAVAIVALWLNENARHNSHIEKGLVWLKENINEDGGYGDTVASESNVSTSLLCYAALYCFKQEDPSIFSNLRKVERYLLNQNIQLTSSSVIQTILDFYGKDLTFSIPILTMLAICGVIDNEAFNKIPQLPFEFTVLPVSFYKFFNLQVVSYAIPALVAVGIALFKNKGKGNRILYFIRKRSIKKALSRLEEMLPESGGYLEAIPLTAFVNLCLNFSKANSPVVIEKGIMFLENQQRANGSWPIDTDLSTWVTTLSIKAIGRNNLNSRLNIDEIDILQKHLLSLQYSGIHPFNKARPGGWGWTNYSGSVPDADDTSGAIIALLNLTQGTKEEVNPVLDGCLWLCKLQNNDGGIPTFSRGWGRLPFDSSCPDISGHAFLAWIYSLDALTGKVSIKKKKIIQKSVNKILKYLRKTQGNDGAWVPLWFGNQNARLKTNKVYGTAKVVSYLNEALTMSSLDEKDKKIINGLLTKARKFISTQQNEDGSWGGEKGVSGTIEETSLAISALTSRKNESVLLKALNWVNGEIEKNGIVANPIGLYFATLWYDEKLYPLIFYVEALRKYLDIYKKD